MSGQTGLRALVVIPTYNELANLPGVVEEVLAAGPEFHVLVVDDGSPDGTGEMADALAAASPRVGVMHRERKSGLGAAYIAGLSRGLEQGFDYLITMDGDHSHDPATLPRLLSALTEDGADVAVGSRWVDGGGTRGWPLYRRMLSRGGSKYARTVLRLDVRDATGGFKCLSRAAVNALEVPTIRSTGYAFNIEITYRAVLRGLKVTEVPIVFTERTEGTSKMSLRIVVEALLRVPGLRTTTLRPLMEQPSILSEMPAA